MATNILSEHLTEVADAIRTVEGSTGEINPQDFAARILALGDSGNPITGEVRIFYDETKPASKWGGTWSETEFPYGTYLMAAGGYSAAGAKVDASLPNITGYFEIARHLDDGTMTAVDGKLFSIAPKSGGGISRPATGSWEYLPSDKITFDASKANGIYGKATTVRPDSRTVHIWRRVS